MGETPEYFKDFLVEFRKGRDEVSEIKTSLEEARTEWREETSKNSDAIAHNSNDIQHLKAHSALVDNFEVLILGLPSGSTLSHDEAMRKLLAILGLKDHILDKAEYREWMPNRASQQPVNGQPINHSQHGFVIELHTAKDRDRLVAASPKLKNLTANAVFGEGGNSTVSIRQLWPKEVHALFRVALRACKQHRFPRPIVSNLVVSVRRSKNSPFTPLLSLGDLNTFLGKPAENSSEDMDYSLSQSTSQTSQLSVFPVNPTQSSSAFNFGNQG